MGDPFGLKEGSLLLDMGPSTGSGQVRNAIHIENWDQAHPLDRQGFASFQFADGSSLSRSDLLARGFDLDGTEGDDVIVEESESLLDTRESRRWWHGERSVREGNDTAWRRAA
ncbi:MAG: calcium-binding hemolysin protein [Rhodocyclaceae bacterium]|nr:MAG: calcium-binding hemolysin protein [Rhodocyclaceae bacterium]TNC97579.1 MAG: calcium-binding hemolysin protein [Rhodocyclaceae bacterium]